MITKTSHNLHAFPDYGVFDRLSERRRNTTLTIDLSQIVEPELGVRVNQAAQKFALQARALELMSGDSTSSAEGSPKKANWQRSPSSAYKNESDSPKYQVSNDIEAISGMLYPIGDQFTEFRTNFNTIFPSEEITPIHPVAAPMNTPMSAGAEPVSAYLEPVVVQQNPNHLAGWFSGFRYTK